MLMASNAHNARFLRFMLILITVILTIFLYVSYSTTSEFVPSLHLRSVAPIGQQALPQLGAIDELRLQRNQGQQSYTASNRSQDSRGGEENQRTAKTKLQHHHRLPTIDADAIADGGGGGGTADAANDVISTDEQLTEDQQYIQNIENNSVMGNIPNNGAAQTNQQKSGISQQQQQQQQQEKFTNNIGNNDSSNNNSNNNKIADVAEVLIPTTNLQKFIESADRILKNATNNNNSSSSSITGNMGKILVGKGSQPSKAGGIQQSTVNKNNNNGKSIKTDHDGAIPSSAIMHLSGAAANKPKQQNKKRTNSKSTAPLTESLYESGHLDEEINIEQICPNQGAKMKLLIMITSAPGHVEARDAIRKTWAALTRRRDTGLAFILGRTTDDVLNMKLTKENEIFGDLVRGNFIDSYNNLTLKTISTLEWFDNHCRQAKYLLKTDDDMFINVPKLLTFLNSKNTSRVIYGRSAKDWKPIRNVNSKYFLSQELYPAAVFPVFNTGPAYVLSTDTVRGLYAQALQMVYLKLEDVFITGIVAEKLKIKRVNANEFQNRRVAFNTCNLRRIISTHKIKPSEHAEVYFKFLDSKVKCK